MPVVVGSQDLPQQQLPASRHAAPVISNETPKLEGIPANNRIFVDGRAYEVSYINDIPVIERNGLPHRFVFMGGLNVGYEGEEGILWDGVIFT